MSCPNLSNCENKPNSEHPTYCSCCKRNPQAEYRLNDYFEQEYETAKNPWPEIAKDTIPELDAYLRRCLCVEQSNGEK
jgi:hypothetical protein